MGGDQLWFSIKVMLIGMLIVFTGLVVLIACVKAMSFFIGSKRGGKGDKDEGARKEEKAVEAPKAVEQVVKAVVPEADQGELIAVISAALAMYASSGKALVVRSIRKASGKTPAWAQAGRREQLNSRF